MVEHGGRETRDREGTVMRSQVDDQILVEMSATTHLARLRRILEALEAGDRPHFNFYAHEHPEEGRAASIDGSHGGHAR